MKLNEMNNGQRQELAKKLNYWLGGYGVETIAQIMKHIDKIVEDNESMRDLTYIYNEYLKRTYAYECCFATGIQMAKNNEDISEHFDALDVFDNQYNPYRIEQNLFDKWINYED